MDNPVVGFKATPHCEAVLKGGSFDSVSFKWSIHDFLSVLNHCSPNEFVQSPVFDESWYLQVYPRSHSGSDDAEEAASSVDPDFVTVYAVNARDHDVTASVKFAVVNGSQSMVTRSSLNSGKFPAYQGRACSDLVKRTMLKMNSYHFLNNGALTIHCEIFEQYQSDGDSRKSSDSLTHQSMQNSYSSFVPDVYEKLVGSELCSDVTFMIDGSKLHAHQVILMSSSMIFRDMLLNATLQEDDKKVIEIENVDYAVFRELIRFLYTGKVSNLEATANDLLIVSHRFGAEPLKTMCEKVLCRDTRLDNALRYLKVADFYGCAELKAKALNFLSSSVDEVFQRPEYAAFDDAKLLKEILAEVARKKRDS